MLQPRKHDCLCERYTREHGTEDYPACVAARSLIYFLAFVTVAQLVFGVVQAWHCGQP